MAEVVFYTIPSKWLRADSETLAPYHRVVGIEHEDGRVDCGFDLSATPQPLRFEVPAALGRLTAQFFEQHLAEVDIERAALTSSRNKAGAAEVRAARYDCHSFALAARGIPGLSRLQTDNRLFDISRHASPLLGRLAAGEHGIVRSVSPNFRGISHSFIGLGEGETLTLQVMERNGNMGLLPYGTLLAQYSLLCYAPNWELAA